MDKPNKRTKFNLDEVNNNKNNKNKNKSTNTITKVSNFNGFNSFTASTQSVQPPSASTSTSNLKPLRAMPLAPDLSHKPPITSTSTFSSTRTANRNGQNRTLEFGIFGESVDSDGGSDVDLRRKVRGGEKSQVKGKWKGKGKEKEIEPVKKKLGNMNVFNSFGTSNPLSSQTSRASSPSTNTNKPKSNPSKLQIPSSTTLKPLPKFHLASTSSRPTTPTPHNLRPLQVTAPPFIPPNQVQGSPPSMKSPPKPLLSTSITSRGMFLLPKEEKEDSEENEDEGEGSSTKKGLSNWRPISPSKLFRSRAKGNEGDAGMMGEGGIMDSWSPRKKRRGGYLLDGLASRAKSTLESSSTSHSLWLHEISRSLAGAQTVLVSTENQLTRNKLRDKLRPDIRLIVEEIMYLRKGSGSGMGGGENLKHWEESKIVLARCRILLVEGNEEGVQDGKGKCKPLPQDAEEEAGPDTQGLVLFSIHLNPSTKTIDPKVLLQTTSTISISRTRSRSLSSSPSKSQQERDQDKNSNLVIPTSAHDLNLIKKGMEIWCWEPWHEITLPSAESQIRKKLFVDEMKKAEMDLVEGEEEEEEGDVFWDSRPAKVVELERERRRVLEDKEREEEEERVNKALIFSRFGIVV